MDCCGKGGSEKYDPANLLSPISADERVEGQTLINPNVLRPGRIGFEFLGDAFLHVLGGMFHPAAEIDQQESLSIYARRGGLGWEKLTACSRFCSRNPASTFSVLHPGIRQASGKSWPENGQTRGNSTKNPEAFQLRDSLILKKKCSKEDSNLHRFPY